MSAVKDYIVMVQNGLLYTDVLLRNYVFTLSVQVEWYD